MRRSRRRIPRACIARGPSRRSEAREPASGRSQGLARRSPPGPDLELRPQGAVEAEGFHLPVDAGKATVELAARYVCLVPTHVLVIQVLPIKTSVCLRETLISWPKYMLARGDFHACV